MKKCIKQKNYFLLSVLILFIFSCNSKNDARKQLENFVESSEFINEGYEKIGADLYTDTAGNIYFKTIDRSAIDEIKFSYHTKMYYDTIIDGDSTYLEKEIKQVVDVETFKQYKKDDLTRYFKDKNHYYFHREQADGGMLHCYK